MWEWRMGEGKRGWKKKGKGRVKGMKKKEKERAACWDKVGKCGREEREKWKRDERKQGKGGELAKRKSRKCGRMNERREKRMKEKTKRVKVIVVGQIQRGRGGSKWKRNIEREKKRMVCMRGNGIRSGDNKRYGGEDKKENQMVLTGLYRPNIAIFLLFLIYFLSTRQRPAC